METNDIQIPFGAQDSELKGWEYTIPEGMEAIIKDGKVIVREKESEDERIRKEAISIVQSYMNICDEEGDPCLSGYKVLAYLERQKDSKVVKFDHDREQKPVEWSDEDKAMLKVAIAVLRRYSHDDVADWLKSLRPQPHWKPSEEQMEALERASTNEYLSARQYDILVSLYEKLTKLM
jgi:hypothetical protein